jgi:hypothetical protein
MSITAAYCGCEGSGVVTGPGATVGGAEGEVVVVESAGEASPVDVVPVGAVGSGPVVVVGGVVGVVVVCPVVSVVGDDDDDEDEGVDVDVDVDD